ncbi:MAG: hypothetical protein QME81_03480 [bacterium]|nr:hypothetical protein [bacterium]
MNFIYRVSVALSVALSVMILFVVGAGLIALSLGLITPEMITVFGQTLAGEDVPALTGLILWVVCLFVVYTDYRLNQQEKEGVSLHHPLGEVKISRTALIEAINQIGDRESYVKEIKRTRIKSSRKGVKVFFKVVIWTEIPVPEAMTTLQEKIKAYLEEVIGAPKCKEVKVMIVKILHTEVSRPKRKGGEIYG